MWRSSVHPHRVSQRHSGWNQKSPIWTPDQRTTFDQSNVHCLCFLAQSSLFLLLVSFSSGFFVAIYTVSSEQLMLRCVCYMNSVKCFSWAAISEAGNSNELILCSRGHSGSSFPVAVLMRDSFIITLNGFWDCTWRNFQSSWNVPHWLTFMS